MQSGRFRLTLVDVTYWYRHNSACALLSSHMLDRILSGWAFYTEDKNEGLGVQQTGAHPWHIVILYSVLSITIKHLVWKVSENRISFLWLETFSFYKSLLFIFGQQQQPHIKLFASQSASYLILEGNPDARNYRHKSNKPTSQYVHWLAKVVLAAAINIVNNSRCL